MHQSQKKGNNCFMESDSNREDMEEQEIKKQDSGNMYSQQFPLWVQNINYKTEYSPLRGNVTSSKSDIIDYI